MFDAQHYTYRVFWSEEDQEYVGTVTEFPLLSYVSVDRIEALQGITEVVKEAIGIYKEEGKEVPVPLGEKRYSGKYALRMTPEQHRRIAIEAAESGVSINQLITSRV